MRRNDWWMILEPFRAEKKNFIRRKIFLIAAYLLLLPAVAYAESPEITAEAAILIDATTGQVFYAKNPHQQRSPASLTKIMTALLALEGGNLDDVVTVSGKAASFYMGQTIGLHTGEKITLRNLLKAALIISANDSTVAIAEHIGGSEERFIQMMNAKAVLLGALHTRYANTNGYTQANHYSTAYDLALITRYALKKPQFRKFVSTRDDVVEWVGQPRKQTVHNTNRLLSDGYLGIYGIKTGSTASAGNCLIAAAGRSDRELLTVVLHSQNRYLDTIKLLDYGFEQIESIYLCRKGEFIRSCLVQEGVFPWVMIVANEDMKVDILRDELAGLKRKVSLDDFFVAPVQTGQKLGQVVFYLREEELGRVDLVAAQTVPRKRWVTKIRERVFG